MKLYERQADVSKKLRNLENRLPAPQSELSRDIIKDPYIFEFVGLKEKIVEKDIETAMLEQIKTVLPELGKGFSFVGNQYRISTPNSDYLIDLLFYHLELRCYVVVELKTWILSRILSDNYSSILPQLTKLLKKTQIIPRLDCCFVKEKIGIRLNGRLNRRRLRSGLLPMK